MARPSELTQDLVNDAADQLKAQGKKPSPNAVSEIVGTGISLHKTIGTICLIHHIQAVFIIANIIINDLP